MNACPEDFKKAHIPGGYDAGTKRHTHFDLNLGNGWETFGDGVDRRYVYPDSTTVVYCVITSTGANPSELSATYSVAGDQVDLDNGNSLTAISWSSDAILFSNNLDDSLELHQRR